MGGLVQQIEEMRARMNELAAGEQELVRALGDALSRTDQKLMEDVRSAAADHEVRRGAILNELQSLAARMGALPGPREQYASMTEAPQRAVRPGGADGALATPQDPYQDPYDDLTVALGVPRLTRRGDWRQAAANIEATVNENLMGRESAN